MPELGQCEKRRLMNVRIEPPSAFVFHVKHYRIIRPCHKNHESNRKIDAESKISIEDIYYRKHHFRIFHVKHSEVSGC